MFLFSRKWVSWGVAAFLGAAGFAALAEEGTPAKDKEGLPAVSANVQNAARAVQKVADDQNDGPKGPAKDALQEPPMQAVSKEIPTPAVPKQ